MKESIRAELVLDGHDLLVVQAVQERREDAPGLAQLVRAHEVRLDAREHVHHEALVRVGQLDILSRT